MSEENKYESLKYVGLMILLSLFFWGIPEYLILGFEQEARDDWPRMLPSILIGPSLWNGALFISALGVYVIYMSIKEKMYVIVLCGVYMLIPGIGIPYYWIKRIIVDDVPAFGYNPDNIYAVTGINTMDYLMLWGIVGLGFGFVIAFILTIRDRLKTFFKKNNLGK